MSFCPRNIRDNFCKPKQLHVYQNHCARNCSIPPCQQKIYPAEASTLAHSRITKERYVRQYAEFVTLEGLDGLPLDDTNSNEQAIAAARRFMEDDFVSFHVNYYSITTEHWNGNKGMTVTELWANIGGQMGLFLGISFVSIIEVFGELLTFRLLPRLWGDKRLYGLGSKHHVKHD